MGLFPKESKKRGPAKHKMLRIRSSELELLRYQQAAGILSLETSTWARTVLRDAAGQLLLKHGKEHSL